MSLGKRIKQERERQGLTQEELARKAGLKNQQTIQSLESRESQKSAHASKIAAALSVDLDWLLGDTSKKAIVSETQRESAPQAQDATKRPLSPALSQDEEKLIKLFSMLSNKQQKALIDFLEPETKPAVQDPRTMIKKRNIKINRRTSNS